MNIAKLTIQNGFNVSYQFEMLIANFSICNDK